MATPWSSKGSKATPVGADELLIIDSADANPATTNKLITIGSMPFVANPLTSDLDADGNALLDANYLEVGSALATTFADAGEIRFPDLGGIYWRNGNDDGNFSIISEDEELTFTGWTTISIPTADVDVDLGSANLTGLNSLEVGSGGIDLGDGPMTSVISIQYTGSNIDTALGLGNLEQISWDNSGAGFVSVGSSVSNDFIIGFSATDVGPSTPEYTFTTTAFTIADANNIAVGTTTGTQIGTASTQLLGFYGTTAVNQPDALTAQDTTITSAAPGSPDFAIQTLTQTSPFGFVTSDEAQTVLQVIANLQTRVQELEDRLEELGLIAAN